MSNEGWSRQRVDQQIRVYESEIDRYRVAN